MSGQKHFLPAELKTLRRLRDRFLQQAEGADYWRSPEELALYDSTFGERIGWKWDAVLTELAERDWEPRSRHLVDWGCGSGQAHRRVLEKWPGHFQSLVLHDRSPLAVREALNSVRQSTPAVELRGRLPEAFEPGTLVVLSHVINELPDRVLSALVRALRGAEEILWVEPGTHAESRRLIEKVREPLLATAAFSTLGPCTHDRPCGLLAPGNEPHWCHSFAAVPNAAFQSGRWAEFSREMGIDLRSLPYSFLALQRRLPDVNKDESQSRMIGKPREYKGFAKVLSCQADGVYELELQKRDDPALFREVTERAARPLYRWLRKGQRIQGDLGSGGI